MRKGGHERQRKVPVVYSAVMSFCVIQVAFPLSKTIVAKFSVMI